MDFWLSNIWANINKQYFELKTPAQLQSLSLSSIRLLAVSVPKKNFKGELTCFFQAKQGTARTYVRNIIYVSKYCIIIRKEKDKFFTKNQIVGYVKASDNHLYFQKL